MTDNRTTELLRELRDLVCDINAAEIIDHVHITRRGWKFDSQWLDSWHHAFDRIADKLEQAIAATLKSNAKPCYATDENYKRCKYSVNRGWCDNAPFLVWDDTGHLFITMGSLKTWDVTDDAKKWFAELGSDEPLYDELIRCLENDWNIHASWDGLRKFWCIELTEEGVKLRDKVDMLQRRNDELRTSYDKLNRELDNLAADLLMCNREREQLRKNLGIALDHAHDICALVDIDGNVLDVGE